MEVSQLTTWTHNWRPVFDWLARSNVFYCKTMGVFLVITRFRLKWLRFNDLYALSPQFDLNGAGCKQNFVISRQNSVAFINRYVNYPLTDSQGGSPRFSD